MLPFIWIALFGSPIFARAATGLFALENAVEPAAGWTLREPARDSDVLTLFVALKQPGMQQLKSQLAQSSTLTKRNTAGHISRNRIKDYRKPNATSTPEVLNWLDSHGIRDSQTHDGWVSFNVTALAARTLLNADLVWYSYGNNSPVLRTRSYTVPSWLKAHIDFIHPLVHFLPPRTHHTAILPSQTPYPKRPPVQQLPCSDSANPSCIRQLYNLSYSPTFPSPSRLGLAGFLDQYVNPLDLTNFMTVYASELTPMPIISIVLLNNGTNPLDLSKAGSEASVDAEYALSLAHPVHVNYFSTGGRGAQLDPNGSPIPMTDSDNEPYLEFLQEMLALDDALLPHVLSISYADDEQSVPRAYAERVCDLFALLSARGVSVLSASGDGGAAGTGHGLCLSNDGRQMMRLLPTFPASCPYVTAVGAVGNGGPPVMGAGFSSGGFSEYFARPGWQDGVVEPYLTKLAGDEQNKGLFNMSGRAIPDISAIGSGFLIENAGQAGVVLGTSASTPVVAAMVALVNDKRLREGKPSLGWLNPFLYGEEVRGVLSDVTTGSSYGCYFAGVGEPVEGWRAEEGYDCVTGLGVPGNFGRLLQVLG